MNIRSLVARVGMIGVLLGTPILLVRNVAGAAMPQLVISQFKVTSSGGQFVTLYNQSAATLDLGQFEVDYLNSSNKLSSLPISGQLAAHSFYMLNDDQVRLCFQMTIDTSSLGFATTSGTLQVWQLSSDKTSKVLQDSVSWASKATAGAVTLPTQNSSSTVSLLRQPTDSLGNPQVTAATYGTWQAVAPDSTNPCALDIMNTDTAVPSPSSNPGNQLAVGQAPPATIISLASGDSSAEAPSLPIADIGLAAPQITELLPNPMGTGTDDTDEFIELYNPNPTEFHLIGFTLQTGVTTKHSYTFPDGTLLPPKGFKAFYSSETGLSLSNTSGQADLLDPFGNPLGQSDVYGTAKDGQAWALAKGTWYWTGEATPNAANVIQQTTASKSKKTTAKKSAGSVKGASTTGSGNTSGGTDTTGAMAPAPVHPSVLVVVAVLAVGYGVYEYRHDIANRLHQFRSHRAARRAARA